MCQVVFLNGSNTKRAGGIFAFPQIRVHVTEHLQKCADILIKTVHVHPPPVFSSLVSNHTLQQNRKLVKQSGSLFLICMRV